MVLYGCETLVTDIKGERRLKVFENQGAEENIWTEEGWSDGRLEKTA
jgi:hypothetical protein